MSYGLFKRLPTNYSFTNHIYRIHIYEQDLALNYQQGLICHKTQPSNHYKDGLGTKVDTSLNKETKSNQTFA